MSNELLNCNMKKEIVFFTKYTEKGPSSRYRSYQYFPYLKENGFEVIVKPFFPARYIDELYIRKRKSLFLAVSSYFRRLFQLLIINSDAILFIEYELFPFMPLFLEKTLLWGKKNIVVDYDDAIFHNYDQSANFLVKKLLSKKIPGVMKRSSHVITGSCYLTGFAKNYSRLVTEIPTSVSFKKYKDEGVAEKPSVFTIGWIGVPSNSNNVLNILPAIKDFALGREVKLLLIGFDKSLDAHFEGLNVEIREWDESSEIRNIKSFTVGIMPLVDTPFNRGKCGFKLIQYMACGIPTISTPLPANVEINRSRENLLPSSTKEWLKALIEIYDNPLYFAGTVGLHNEQIVADFYSIEANSKRIVSVFNKMTN